jgi:hypothetical protein
MIQDTSKVPNKLTNKYTSAWSNFDVKVTNLHIPWLDIGFTLILFMVTIIFSIISNF